jgi:hypothetical protein
LFKRDDYGLKKISKGMTPNNDTALPYSTASWPQVSRQSPLRTMNAIIRANIKVREISD